MLLGHTVKFSQVALGLIPEVFDAIDVVLARGEQCGVIDRTWRKPPVTYTPQSC